MLIIVNELNDTKFREAAGRLVDAASIQLFPDFFFDTNGDGFAVPLDALIIINFLNRIVEPEGEELFLPLDNHDVVRSSDPIHAVPRTAARSALVTANLRAERAAPAGQATLPTTSYLAPATRRLSYPEYLRELDELLADLAADGMDIEFGSGAAAVIKSR